LSVGTAGPTFLQKSVTSKHYEAFLEESTATHCILNIHFQLLNNFIPVPSSIWHQVLSSNLLLNDAVSIVTDYSIHDRIMITEWLVERKSEGKTKAYRDYLSQSHSVHHKSHIT
jgi:hypothetical protein